MEGVILLGNVRLEVLRFLADNEGYLIDSGNLFSIPGVDLDDLDILEKFNLIGTCDINCHYHITGAGRKALSTGKHILTEGGHKPNGRTIKEDTSDTSETG